MTKAKNKTQTLIVRVLRVRNTSDGFSIYTAQPETSDFDGASDTFTTYNSYLTVKQFCGPVRSRQRWCIAGSEVNDPRWGPQFVAQFATLATPTTEHEMADFLASGLVDGWDMYSYLNLQNAAPAGVLARYLAEPEFLPGVEGVTSEMITSLNAAWQRGSGLAPVYVQLADWGCTSRQSDALVKHYGFKTVEELTANPYADIQEINGYGWKTAESIAQALGIPADDPRRIRAGLETAVYEATWQAGHTWLHNNDALAAACRLLELPMNVVGHELDASVAYGHLVRDGVKIYPEPLYRAEQAIAAQIQQRVSNHGNDYQEIATSIDPIGTCSALQTQAVLMALAEPICMLTGGPGTGKTTALKTLIESAHGCSVPVTCMAPTGKAAARMTEATGMQATTIHSRLRLKPGQNVMPEDFEPVTGLVIVDEVSMLDTSLAAAMLERISMSAQILLVGDPDQLPSVGPGAVLRDLIAADILPRVHLDHVYRNEAGIAVNAARMRDGKDFLSLPDCRIIPAETPEHASRLILGLLSGLESDDCPASDALVLCPTNDGASGRYALNAQLQPLINDAPEGSGITQYVPSAKDPDGTIRKRSEELRPGDKVMVIKNSSELGVFNGQTGTVVDLNAPKSLDVEIDGQVVTFAGEDKRMLTLAYAITGHKSQGSEAPIVIAPIFPSRVLSREWLYTVITRARQRVYLIGDRAAIQGCIAVQRCNERRTGLVEALARGNGNG